MAVYNGVTYDPNTDYMKLINQANAAGDYAKAAQYEQQRNAKIAATNSSYAQTNNYANYANGSNSAASSNTSGGQNYLYNKNTDYQKLINDSVSAGNYTAAAQYEQMRNAKIRGEGLDAATTSNWSSYLPGNASDSYVPAQTDSYIDSLTSIINTMLTNQNYQPVDQSQYMDNAMGYDEAYKLAQSIITPQYADTYEQTARAAQQRLASAGLSDSLYGQALAAQSENQINKDMNAAIGNLALSIQDMSYDQAYKLLQAAMQESQYGNSAQQNALANAAGATNNIIGALQDAADARNDYSLKAESLKLQQQAQALQQQYYQGLISGQDLDNKMKELELQAAQMAMNENVDTAVYSTGSGSNNNNNPINNNPVGPKKDYSQTTYEQWQALINNSSPAALYNSLNTLTTNLGDSTTLTQEQRDRLSDAILRKTLQKKD